ncbi:MAG: type II toxin-antitoxin system RelE/ParE family toxin [Proteobacteria bacterium]|nr:type II toxin-antitoxin system RelE/ParE family toxin [Pseudomonadota bacterium]
MQGIYGYIARDNENAAENLRARIESLAEKLRDQPYMGQKLPGSTRRRFPVAPYPYLIYYDVVGNTVRILRIRHAARYRAAFQEPARAFAG